jgi:hypothetical protein
MSGNNHRSPPGSPVIIRNMATSRKPPPSTRSLKNKAIMRLQDAISKVSLPNTAVREENRNKQNPNNAIFIDRTNHKVYKIGLWIDSERCIRNEFIAYTLLLKKKGDDMNIHYPEMFDCQKIAGTKYAMVILQYIPNIKMVCIPPKNNNQVIKNNNNNNVPKCDDLLNNTNRNNLIEQAYDYLINLGIIHNDERENLFVHSINNEKTFLWMDFEAATFNKGQLNLCSELLLQNNVQIRTMNSTFTSPIMSSSPTKKRKQEINNHTKIPNPFANWNNNN